MVFNLIIAALAAWRITSALNRELIGKVFRQHLAGEREDHYGVTFYNDTFLGNLISCFMCLSFWVSIGCTIVAVFYPIFLYPFAISTVVIFIDEKM
jgi:prolipoprotein diacylglyceryltransferase